MNIPDLRPQALYGVLSVLIDGIGDGMVHSIEFTPEIREVRASPEDVLVATTVVAKVWKLHASRNGVPFGVTLRAEVPVS